MQNLKNYGLVYTLDDVPGFTRRRWGRGFSYLDPDGKRVADSAEIQRFKALAIPPAYRDVWICVNPLGHLQATGLDERERKQYRYHERWTEVRNLQKFDKIVDFADALPEIRRRVSLDLKGDDLSKERVTAAIVRLLESTHLRIGSLAYAKENASYGLTTLQPEHLELDEESNRIHLEFVGKSGKLNTADLTHPTVSKILAECQELPGQELFRYRLSENRTGRVESTDVNDYIQRTGGNDDFSAKDFRTWAATVLCAHYLMLGNRSLVDAIKETARELHHTPATCRKYYIHPAIAEAFESGELQRLWKRMPDRKPEGSRPHDLTAEEQKVLALLR